MLIDLLSELLASVAKRGGEYLGTVWDGAQAAEPGVFQVTETEERIQKVIKDGIQDGIRRYEDSAFVKSGASDFAETVYDVASEVRELTRGEPQKARESEALPYAD